MRGRRATSGSASVTASSGYDRADHHVTRFGACAARLGADPAVLHHLGVALTFLGARTARRNAGLELRPKRVDILLAGTRHEPGRSSADIRAVQVGPDANAERCRVGFFQAGVGARRADEHALGRGRHHRKRFVARVARRGRVGGEHLSNSVHGSNHLAYGGWLLE